MKYIIYFPLSIIVTVICYLTNWFVCLFANEVGDLPEIFKYWQTWDDSCDVEFFVKEKVPSIFRYDFDKYYKAGRQETEELSALGRDRGCVFPTGAEWTTKDKIKRYFCRVLWLTRNNAYGWSFYVFGVPVKGNDLEMVEHYTNDDGSKSTVGYEKNKNIFARAWIYHKYKPLAGRLWYDVFLGWKVDVGSGDFPKMAMIAGRIVPRWKK